MITSQNMSSEPQVKKFFIRRKVMLRSQENGKMSTIKMAKTHFNKIIKGFGKSFQSPALSQKHVRNVCHTAY